jgi:hypothetical protein
MGVSFYRMLSWGPPLAAWRVISWGFWHCPWLPLPYCSQCRARPAQAIHSDMALLRSWLYPAMSFPHHKVCSFQGLWTYMGSQS